MIERKKLDIPKEVSGRPVTNRGVHLQPFGYHGFWLDREVQDAYWTTLLKSMGISWVVILNEGDSVLEERHGTTPLKTLLDAGIIPIIRDKQSLPRPFLNVETVKRTVKLYAQYGLCPFWQLYNEPFDPREWEEKKGKKGKPPPRVPPYDEAWEIIATRWSQGASQVVGAGAYVGFPDGPCYAENPFERLRPAGGLEFFNQGMAFYAPHTYGKGRPLWYPYDAVTRYGAPLTDEAYRHLLDDYADSPNWYDAPAALLNQQRQEWADPTRTALQDDTCWRGWEKIVDWALESLGYVPPMAMTEGGWTPRDRAGSTPVDVRWPHSTPQMVAKKTVQMYDTPSPFFAICAWLLVSEDMGGVGWYDDAWHGGAFSDKYGRQKPVIPTLQKTPPKEVQSRLEPMVIDLDGDTRDWAWVELEYGAAYRRGQTALRLIQVHEYEGPATLEVLVVDGDGLPVEGVEFYYYHLDAPAIETGASPELAEVEWYPQGVLQTTSTKGRLSFPVSGSPAAPGACVGAIWPKGRGDALEKLGLLAGTCNRHLNGVWQWMAEGAPPPEPGPEPEPEPGPQPEPEPRPEPEPQPEPEPRPKPEPQPEPEPEPGPQPEPEPGVENGLQPQPKLQPSAWKMAVEYRPGSRIIAGSFPRKDIQLTVADPWGNSTTVTSGSKPEYGPGGFEVLASHPVVYTLAFLGERFQVQMQDGAAILTFTETTSPGPGPEPGPEPGPGPGPQPPPEPQPARVWKMAVEYRSGSRIVAGSFPRKDIQLTVTDPWGNSTTVTSGAKPEYGPGGFEVLAPHPVVYTLAFLGERFQVQMQDGAAILTFTETTPPGPGPEHGPGPAPEPEHGPGPRCSKLGFYLEATSVPGLAAAIRDVRPPVILIHAGDRGLLRDIRRSLSPNSFVVGRIVVELGEQNAWLDSDDPEGRARAFADRILHLDFGLALERGENGRLLIDAWMSLNECVPGPASKAYHEGNTQDKEAIRKKAGAYDRFQVAFRNRLREADPQLEAVAMNFGAGNFSAAAGYIDWFPRTLQSYVYLGFHEYGWPALADHILAGVKSSAGTYRAIMQGIRAKYGDRHKAIVTEAGLARMYKYSQDPAGDVGWLYGPDAVSQDDYWRSLKWYNGWLCGDDFVLGACLFEVGHSGKWETFRHLGVDNQGNPIQIIPRIKALADAASSPGP